MNKLAVVEVGAAQPQYLCGACKQPLNRYPVSDEQTGVVCTNRECARAGLLLGLPVVELPVIQKLETF